MTRKHFVELAEALRQKRPIVRPDGWTDHRAFVQWQEDCLAVANVCRGFNDNFDKFRFIEACEGR